MRFFGCALCAVCFQISTIVSVLLAITAVPVKMEYIVSPVFVHMDTLRSFVTQVRKHSLNHEIRAFNEN